MERAMIGVIPLYDFAKSSYWMLPGYLEGLMEAGGLPVVLPLTADGAMLTQIANQCSGFLFTGGQDVTPEIYGAAALPCCGERCPARDEMEQALLPLILERDKPLLGICRGIQILNAALGGTLYQDLPEQHPSEVTHRQAPPYDLPAHEVELTADSPLRELLGKERLAVNSCHHQAIRTLAPGLRAMAYARGRIGGGGLCAGLPLGVGGPVAPGIFLPAGCGQPEAVPRLCSGGGRPGVGGARGRERLKRTQHE